MSDDSTRLTGDGEEPSEPNLDYTNAKIPEKPQVYGTVLAGTTQALPVPGERAEDLARDPGAPARLAKKRTEFYTRAGLKALPKPTWLIQDVLIAGSLAWLGAPYNSGKTFMVTDWASCISTGRNWRGRPVKQGPVIQLLAEGASGMDQRLTAWEKANGIQSEVIVYPYSIRTVERGGASFRMTQEWLDFCTVCAEYEPVLVTLDTQSRITVGLNENLPYEMAFYVEAVQHLQRLTGACILTVHHGNDSLRGATSVPGGADSVAMMKLEKRQGGNKYVQLRSEKMKDAADFEPMDFTLLPLGESAVLADGAPDWKRGAKGTASVEDGKDGPELCVSGPLELPMAALEEAFEVDERFSSTAAALVLNVSARTVATRYLTPAVVAKLLGREGSGSSTRYWLKPVHTSMQGSMQQDHDNDPQ